MTVYRRNPLLMTVMGANPGPRTRRTAEKALDAAISGAWHRLMSGVQVPIMDIPRIFRDIKLEIAAGVPLEQAVTSVGTRYRVNRNPFGEAIVAGVAGAVMNRAFQSNPGPSFVVIDATTGVVVYTKRATGVGSEAIRSCVVKATLYAQRTGRPHIVFLDMQGVKVGMKVNVGVVRMLGITEEIFPEGHGQGPRARLNPAIRVAWDRLSNVSRLSVLEFAGIPENQAVRLAHRDWSTLPPDVQVEVMKGWRDTTPRRDRGTTKILRRETVPTNPLYRARYLSPSMEAREEMIRARGIKHALKKANRSAERLPKQFTEPRSSVEVERYQPNPGSKRKMTMTIERFAAWVKAKRDPAMWRAFLAKFRGYEKWTHGAKARKVSVEWVDTPGVNGLWITYDGGKQPESTYIMPKGSPRKGAWKHPWDTMPDIKHDPEAKIVITKLRGSSKITDFYHK